MSGERRAPSRFTTTSGSRSLRPAKLRPRALGRSRRFVLYTAHMALRSVDWTIRNHEEFEVQWYLGISTDLLAAVGAE
jgi:hypothetical protein